MKKLLLYCMLFTAINTYAQELFLVDPVKGIWGRKELKGKVDPSKTYYSPDSGYPSFSDGLARMYQFVPDKKNKDSIVVWGYIDELGKVVIPFKYQNAQSFYNGMANVSILRKAEKGDPFIEHLLLDKKGKEYKLPSECKNMNNFQEGRAVVSTSSDFCDGKWGFIDSLGRKITSLKYDQVWDFSEGMAAVNIGASGCQGGKWGFIDKTGQEVIPLIYDKVGMIDGGYDLFGFQFGRATVSLGEEWFYIDKNGLTTKIPQKNENTAVFENEKSHENPVRTFDNTNKKYGFQDANGKTIVREKYDMAFSFDDGTTIVRVKLNNKWAYLNALGKEITPFKYDDGSEFKYGCAIVSSGTYGNSVYGVIDSTGKEIVALGSYDFICNFKNGMAAVKKKGSYGYIDSTGREVIPCIYDRSDGFNNKTGFAVLNKKEGIIDQNGKEVIPFGKYENLEEFSNGFFRFSARGKEGLLNAEGQEIIPAEKYLSIYPRFYDGLSLVSDLNHKRGYINEDGKEIIPCIYDRADDFFNGRAKVKLYDRWFYIDTNGKEIME